MPKVTKMEKFKQQRSKDRTEELGNLLKTQSAVVRKAELKEAANSKRGKARNNAARKSSSFASALSVLRESETSKGLVRPTKEQINNDDKSKRGLEALKKKMRADMENETKDVTNKKATQALVVIPRGSTHQLPRVTKQSEKSKKSSSAKIVQQIPVSFSDDESEEDSEEDSEEELGVKSIHPQQLLDILRRFGDQEVLEEWLEEYRLDDPIVASGLQNACSNMSKNLKDWKTPNDISQDFLFSLRHQGRWHLLAPIATFRGTRDIQKKTIGFVRQKGIFYPWRYAISGWKFATRTDEKLLDSEHYTRLVKTFCDKYNIRLKPGIEVGKGILDVGQNESHVENKLMLAYAFHLLRRKTGKRVDISDPKVDPFEILRSAKGPRPEAEVLVSEVPCDQCEKFRDRIQDITGILFHFKDFLNVGIAKKEKQLSGYRAYAKDSAMPRGRPKTRGLDNEFAVQKFVSKVMKVTKTEEVSREISTHEMTSPKKRKGRADDLEGWENAPYKPTTPMKRHKSNDMPTTKTSTRSKNTIITPPQSSSPSNANFEIRLPSYKETPTQSIPESPAAAKASRKLLERFGYKEAVTKNVHNAKHTRYYD